jgi:glutamine cyclotransferase
MPVWCWSSHHATGTRQQRSVQAGPIQVTTMPALHRPRSVCLTRQLLLRSGVLLLTLAIPAAAKPPQTSGTPTQGVRVLERFPHDPGAFTQGLVYDAGQLYESTGKYGESTLRRVDLASGRVEQLRELPDRLFGEGIVVRDERIVQLTWRAGVGLIYQRESFEPIARFNYRGEGWGLTADDQAWIISDGSHQLRFVDPNDQRELRRVSVHDGSLLIRHLNELEYIDGEVWANVWYQDYIVRIDPADGRVVGYLDLSDLWPDGQQPRADGAVLNGIAWDAAGRRLFVTGKYWPTLFQIEPIDPEPE